MTKRQQGSGVRSGATEPRAPLVSVSRHLDAVVAAVQGIDRSAIVGLVAVLARARSSEARVYVMGNGGSSASASHMVCDLMKTAARDGERPLRAQSLTDNTPLLTAWANDLSYDAALAQQVSAMVDPGDVVILVSASGRSPNIVQALDAAREAGAVTVALVGFDGGAIAGAVDLCIYVDSHDYGVVEDVHVAVMHAVSAALRSADETSPDSTRTTQPGQHDSRC